MTLRPIADRTQDAGPTRSTAGEAEPALSFRESLDRQAVELLSRLLDPSVTAGVPGAGTALAAVAPAQDAASVAQDRLVQGEARRGLRERGQDAASRASRELSGRNDTSSDGVDGADDGLAPGGSARAGDSSASERADVGRQIERDASGRDAAPARSVTGSEATPQARSAQAASGALQSDGDKANAAQAASAQGGNRPTATVGRSEVSSGTALAAGASARATPGGTGSASATAGGVLSVQRAGAGGGYDKTGATQRRPGPDEPPAAQVERGLAQVLRQRGGTLQLKLTPSELGEVRITLTVSQGRVDGTIEASSEPARDLLTRSLEELRASLERRGVTVDRLEVRLHESAGSQQLSGDGAEPRDGNAHGERGEAGGGRYQEGSPRRDPGRGDAEDAQHSASRLSRDVHGAHHGAAGGARVAAAGGWLRLDTTA
jgi:hypothetical protein